MSVTMSHAEYLARVLADLDDAGAVLEGDPGHGYGIDPATVQAMVSFWTILGGFAASVGVSLEVIDRIKSRVRRGSEEDAIRTITATMTPSQIDDVLQATLDIRAGRRPHRGRK